MSDLLVKLEALAMGMPSDTKHVNEGKMGGKICLLSLKFDSSNIDVAKRLTTEGLRLSERITFIRNLSKNVDAEVFEFSTCNRVLYAGFDIDPETLASGVSKMTGLEDIPFQAMTGSDAWRHLVKICSGLDSFIVGELQVMSQLRSSINIHRENNLIRTFNLAFFEHVISATRIIRKELGYTSSTESMLNLATASLEAILAEKGDVLSVVLGFGEMGVKAIETLQELGQTNIVVVSRNPKESANRMPKSKRTSSSQPCAALHPNTPKPTPYLSLVKLQSLTSHGLRPLNKMVFQKNKTCLEWNTGFKLLGTLIRRSIKFSWAKETNSLKTFRIVTWKR